MGKKLKKYFFAFLTSYFLWCGSTLGAPAPYPPPIGLEKINSLNPPVKTNTAALQTVSPVQPQPVDFTVCYKFFKIDSQKLFYLSLAGVNANRFRIDEIQSKNGYILFTVAQKQFLASVITLDSKNSMLKITPCNNTYFFPVGIVQNMFKYIELNLNTSIEKLSIL